VFKLPYIKTALRQKNHITKNVVNIHMTTDTNRVFQVSSNYFWGYRVRLDLMNFDDITSIIKYIKADMTTFFLSRNLQSLANKVEKARFHIHMPYTTYKDLLEQTTDKDVVYLCEHC
jgi:hypothetical protein